MVNFSNKYSRPANDAGSNSGSSVKSSLVSWSHEQVQSWLKETNLGYLSESFKNFDGRLLNELKSMQQESSTTYYKRLEQKLNVHSLEDELNFTAALKAL